MAELSAHGKHPGSEQTAYCNNCPSGPSCWQDHRTRVRELFPDITALADEIAKTHQGPAYIEEFKRQTGQEGATFQEPYLAVMMGNMEDGGRVQGGLPPKERGAWTTKWPLEPRRQM
jgi:hypothetical protein